MRPAISYARTSDGVNVTYATVGEGPATIVIVPPLVFQLDIAWEEPAVETFVTRLAAGATVILFDRRGTGLSAHVPATADNLGLPRLAQDVAAILDATSSQLAVLLKSLA